MAAREKELDISRHEVQTLVQTLEGSLEHDKETIRREQQRLGREAARMDAMQNALLSDLQDLKTQVGVSVRFMCKSGGIRMTVLLKGGGGAKQAGRK